jgi:glyoxylase-like metal-dependent hydrolase (beta-lactamase superfamily II)
MNPVTEYPDGICAIDSGYVRPRLDAIHLMIEQGRAAIIDTGTNQSVPTVLDTLAQKGIARDAVDFVILTHVHLDHAGGAGQLMAALPHARLVVHPRGARHMIDPSKLIEGTIAVYGAEETARTHGTILPVPEARVLIANDGDAIDLAGRELVFYDTPGHARHHNCIHDVGTNSLFTGDMFGLSYRELDRDGRAFVFPATTPIQFDPVAFHASIDRLMTLNARAAYLTHYGRVTDLARLAVDLLRLVDAHAALGASIDTGAAEADALPVLRAGVSGLVQAEAAMQPWGVTPEEAASLMEMDIELNAQGLYSWVASRASHKS